MPVASQTSVPGPQRVPAAACAPVLTLQFATPAVHEKLKTVQRPGVLGMQEDPVRTVPVGTGRPVSPHVAPMLHPMSHALPGVPGTHWEVVMHVPLQRACPDGHA